ncbi:MULTISPECIES: hypothetical protein [unclassified Streptomyces]|uniref:hypothetical protein n=1 Tax=unclassified Streptomyces TaxID=2593676 RepID=UPI0011CD686D|nr:MULTISPECIES: hypothetical protein [unclassified Streptomyces]
MKNAASRSALRSAGLAAACCCTALAAWGASTGGADALSPTARTASAHSSLQCYATQGSPNDLVCYRHSFKAEFRHGEMVYVPLLIQVPTPADPPPATIVGSLNDIRPSATGGG